MVGEKEGRSRVFDYLDHREFLRDCFALRKRQNPAFSYRYVAGRLGIDPGTLNGALKGRRNLDPAWSGALARVLGLTDHEREYFGALMLYGQARNQTEKNLLLEKMLRLRGIMVKTLAERQFNYFRKWYHIALRELLNCRPFRGDPGKLGRLLRPFIRPQEAREAIHSLLELDLVEKDKTGSYRVTDNIVSSGDDVRAACMNNFHLAMSHLASRAVLEIEPQERDFSALTVNCSLDTLQDIKEILRQARRDILQRVGKDRRSDGVLQINFQVFPLTARLDPEEN